MNEVVVEKRGRGRPRQGLKVAWKTSEPDYRGVSWDSFRWFRPEDFVCKCGNCGGLIVNKDFGVLLDQMASELGFPFSIMSGMRCQSYTKRLGIDETDPHRTNHSTGFAVDVSGASQRDLGQIIIAAVGRFTGIGICKDGYVHLDNDPSRDHAEIWEIPALKPNESPG